jgi:glycine cleavage system H protein
MKPEQLLYCETHEWLGLSEDGDQKIGTIGISKFAVDQLNDLVHIELPEIGQTLVAGEEFGEVESVKAVSPLYSPINGEVIAVNSELVKDLDRLGDDPYDAGWVIKAKITDDAGVEKLLSYADYQKQCAEQG